MLSRVRGTGPDNWRLTTAPGSKSLAAEVEAKHRRCDVLVNCAGMTRFVQHAELDALDDALIDDIFRVNWRGAFAAVRVFRPLLKATGNGLVVNISSIAGRDGHGQQRRVLRLEGGARLHDEIACACAGARDPCGVGVAGPGGYRVRARTGSDSGVTSRRHALRFAVSRRRTRSAPRCSRLPPRSCTPTAASSRSTAAGRSPE